LIFAAKMLLKYGPNHSLEGFLMHRKRHLFTDLTSPSLSI
jgi:hypothetical protein